MLLVYTHKITPRVAYIFKHIFVRILKTEVGFTSKIEEFVAHSGPKMSYTRQQLGKEFFVRSQDLLFEQGISDVNIHMSNWGATPCFFATGDNSDLPFDIFAASFYLISRYEEYLPHVKDEHGRFPASESLAFQYGFLEDPVVDLWAFKLKEVLVQRFPEASFETREYRFVPLVDVPVAFSYRKKGLLRTLSGTLRDFFSFRIKKSIERYSVLFGFRPDPLDTFEAFRRVFKEYGLQGQFFFLMANYSAYDHNISSNNPRFRSLIKSVSDYNLVSLMLSYNGSLDMQTIKKERKRLSETIHRPVNRVRQHFTKLHIPESYRNLVELEFKEDFTMGYPRNLGFRASTCTPFYYYDIGFEVQTPLKVYSVPIGDQAFKHYESEQMLMEKIMHIGNEVKRVKGTFMMAVRNSIISTTSNRKEIFQVVINEFSR